MYLQTPTLKLPGMVHGFSTRQGGVSQGPYQSLNLKLPHYPDDDSLDAVLENRQRLAHNLNYPAKSLVACQQVHSAQVHLVTAEDQGRGAQSHTGGIPNTDGLVTNIPLTPLFIMVADCIPVLIADPIAKAIGAVHAGWRGTQQEILKVAIEMMQENYGSLPQDIHIGIGSGIGMKRFEVGPEVAEAFALQIDLKDTQVALQKGEKFHLDLQEINQRQALKLGVRQANISRLAHCTYERSDLFFSYRRDKGVTGRLGAVICLGQP